MPAEQLIVTYIPWGGIRTLNYCFLMVFSLISHSLTSLISNCLNLLVGPQQRPRRLKVFSYKKEMRSWQGSCTGGLCRVLLGFRRRNKREIFSTDMCNFSYYNFVYGQAHQMIHQILFFSGDLPCTDTFPVPISRPVVQPSSNNILCHPFRFLFHWILSLFSHFTYFGKGHSSTWLTNILNVLLYLINISAKYKNLGWRQFSSELKNIASRFHHCFWEV